MDMYMLIWEESVKGESDDIFLETNKKQKKLRENENHDQLSLLLP
jgi:hypothetical protein